MTNLNPHDDPARRYYIDLAAAYVRGKLADAPLLPQQELVPYGLRAGLRLHRFKRTSDLPRVRKVLGILRGLGPESLLDLGSGRGVFLWPLLDAFPWLDVLAIDHDRRRVEELHAVRRGGIARLSAAVMDVHRLALADRCADVVTILEVLEHLPEPGRAAAEALRAARRFVLASVPSRQDDNPEHINLFSRVALERLFRDAGAARVTCEAVLNHLILLARV
jgi:ubiquinone/menaquinone biosynthesis C-methylase UbiE